MTRKMSWFVISATVATMLLAAGVLAGQNKYRDRALDGPYRVVLSDPIVPLAQQAGSLYREHEYLGAMLNQLDREGLIPVSTELLRTERAGEAPVARLLVVCTKR
ncbi:MAG: hypothetical protein IPK26_02660 [Planctomycetes bacterium]|nr:hypothetical protein [Planctomycetota bacterium]